MITAKFLKDIYAEARPIIERHLDDSELLAGMREVVAAQGGDWSSLKALITADVKDGRDDGADGKRVKKILDKADYSAAYADMLGIANMNERNFSAEREASQRAPKPSESMDRLISAAKTAGPRVADIKTKMVESEQPESRSGANVSADVAGGENASPLPCDDLEIPAFLLRAKPPPQPST